jgi:hypothetical protein
MKYSSFFAVLLLCCLAIACSKEETQNELSATWEVVATSGGFTGMGYSPVFDIMIIEDDLSFELLDGEALIAEGHIVYQNEEEKLVNFIGDNVYINGYIDILFDNEKYLELDGDELNLIAPCCDRYNTHFKRK